jgi:hypothetical protein
MCQNMLTSNSLFLILAHNLKNNDLKTLLFFFYRNLKDEEFSDPSFQFDYRGEVPMKGKPRPINMWLLSRKPKEFKPEDLKCPFASMMVK